MLSGPPLGVNRKAKTEAKTAVSAAAADLESLVAGG
jgi:hypothetical protein